MSNWLHSALGSVLNWRGIAVSPDGTKMAACVYNGRIWTSTNSGGTFTEQLNSPSTTWRPICISNNGTVIAAAVENGFIWVSTNSGSNWTQRATSQQWESIVCSSDGTKMYACYQARIYLSTDTGTTWAIAGNSPNIPYFCLCCTPDGTKICASAFGYSSLYISDDSGATWNTKTTPIDTYRVACSANGNNIVIAGGAQGQWYFSSNRATSWSPARGPTLNSTNYVACSSNGDIVIVISGTTSYLSTDYGNTYITLYTNYSGGFRVVSYGMNKFAIVRYNTSSYIYTYTFAGPLPITSYNVSGVDISGSFKFGPGSQTTNFLLNGVDIGTFYRQWTTGSKRALTGFTNNGNDISNYLAVSAAATTYTQVGGTVTTPTYNGVAYTQIAYTTTTGTKTFSIGPSNTYVEVLIVGGGVVVETLGLGCRELVVVVVVVLDMELYY